MAGANPVVGDILEIEVVCQMGNQVGLNIFHYQVTAAVPPNPALLDIADAVDNLLAIPYKNVLNNFAGYRGVGATNLASPRTLQYSSVTRAGNGTAGATALPTQVRGILSWYAGLAGRSFRGRSYIPFPPQLAADGAGQPTVSYTTLLSAIRNAVLGPITVTSGGGSCTLKHGIYHRKASVPFLSQTVFAFTRAKFATQRRSGMYGHANTLPF